MFYLAENHLVALLEVGALVGGVTPGALLPSPLVPWSIMNVRVRLQNVVDMTHASERKAVAMSAQELTGDWASYAIRHRLAARSGPPHLRRHNASRRRCSTAATWRR